MTRNSSATTARVAAIGLIILTSACATVKTTHLYPQGSIERTWDDDELTRKVERFFRATTVKEAAEAVKEAEAIAKDAPATLEISGRLAHFQGNEDEAFEKYMAALASPLNTFSELHMLALFELPLTTTQMRQALALFESISVLHPDDNLRRTAAHYIASWQRLLNADSEAAERALSMRGSLDQFAIITPFDNEDGKGFSSEFPPERELDYKAEYQGTHLPAVWRTKVPLNHLRQIDFVDLVSPHQMVVAYATTWAFVPRAGPYHVRVSTTDAIRMWVNDIEVLTQQRVDRSSVDQFIVPVVLRKGWNRILLKSCQLEEDWVLGVGLTEMSGALISGLKSSAEPQEVVSGEPPGPGFDLKTELQRRVATISSPTHQLFSAVMIAQEMGLIGAALDLSDLYRSEVPDGLFSLFTSAVTAWRAGGRGDTIDIFDHLINQNGDALPRLHLMRALFFNEQGRLDKSRENLNAAIKANPRYRSALLELAANYRRQGWTEDYLTLSLQNQRRWPDDSRIQWDLAQAWEALGRTPESHRIHQELQRQWKGAQDAIAALENDALRRSDFSEALRYRETMCALYPTNPGCLFSLGRIFRQAGRPEDAEKAFNKALSFDSRYVAPLVQLGEMALEKGDTAAAVQYWRKALALNPEDHALADRLEFLAPEPSAVFDKRIPTAEDIRNVLRNRGDVEVFPGANVVFLLDHSVERIKADGSSRKVDTLAMMAVNDTGRDQLMTYRFPEGRLKVLEAWALDPDGSRREASSLRDNEVRFRDLKVGSTVVLQYRHDTHPFGYLAHYPSRQWFFHNVNMQFEESRYELIVPKNAKVSQWGQGQYTHTVSEEAGDRVYSWVATHVPPVISEPSSPPALDLLDQVVISINADWENIAAWDRALIADAFRVTPRIKELARSLTEKLPAKRDKLDAIVRFVMREIRYQQDYENNIAGVKPHSAAVVLERGYGDCKDKSVLIMTLAEEAGISTEFAILRTTGIGRLIKELPWLQFNHAIVHVPAQEGIETPFFVDATPDTLDLSVLRPDVQGTAALVIEPVSGKWRFVDIPLMAAEDNFTIRNVNVVSTFNEDGTPGVSRIELTVRTQGGTAASIRQILRNTDDTRVFAAQVLTGLFPGATLIDVQFDGHDDIVKPLTLTITAESEQLLRSREDSLIVDFPRTEMLAQATSLETRANPLYLGSALTHIENHDQITIPPGWEVRAIPGATIIDNEFFIFERSSTLEGDKLIVSLRYTEKKNVISATEYPTFREHVVKAMENMKQDVVLTKTQVNKTAAGKSKRVRKEN